MNPELTDVIDLREDTRGEPRIRIAVVEDEPLARAALADLIQHHPDVGLAGQAGSVAEALELVERAQPDVVLCDLFLPDGDACGLTLRLRRLPNPPEVVVATLFATPSAAAACISAGARLCLQKEAPPESMVAACMAAARGDEWAGPGAVRPLARHHLTYLEAQVLAEVASGSTNDDIAERLGYSPNYIKDVLASARERLSAKDRAHAAAMAVALRLVRPSSDGRFAPSIPLTEDATADPVF
ncbi:MAG: response regulator transcription factor [Actinobacteria bacterium]|nr:response regulator transcription factor [Actinomycetota bacterium]